MFLKFFNKWSLFQKETPVVKHRQPLNVYQFFGGEKDVDLLLAKNSQLMLSCKIKLPFNDREFDEWIMPLIRHLAQYYLFVPSSYEHHHHHEGGAFEHSLEVGSYAMNLLDIDDGLYNNIEPEFRHHHKTTLPLVIFILAITHDVGKPVTDLTVVSCDKDGVIHEPNNAWKPIKETLYQWAINTKVKYYRVIYYANRPYISHNYHISHVSEKIIQLLPTFKHQTLLQKKMNEIGLDFVNDNQTVWVNFIKKADSASCHYYMSKFGRTPRDTSISDRFFESLQSFYYGKPNNQFTINNQPYFWSNKGIHITYPEGFNQIISVTRNSYAQTYPELNDPMPDNNNIVLKHIYEAGHLLQLNKENNESLVHDIFIKLYNEEDPTHWYVQKLQVISLKQAHLYKTLYSNIKYQCKFTENDSEDYVIPSSARDIKQFEQSFYDSLNDHDSDSDITINISDDIPISQEPQITIALGDPNIIDQGSREPQVTYVDQQALNKINANEPIESDQDNFQEPLPNDEDYIQTLKSLEWPEEFTSFEVNQLLDVLDGIRINIAKGHINLDFSDSDPIGLNENGLYINQLLVLFEKPCFDHLDIKRNVLRNTFTTLLRNKGPVCKPEEKDEKNFYFDKQTADFILSSSKAKYTELILSNGILL